MNAKRKKEALLHLRFVKTTFCLPAALPIAYKAYREHHRAAEAEREHLRLAVEAKRARHKRDSLSILRKQLEDKKRLTEAYWRAVGAGSNRFEATSTDSYGKCTYVAKLWQSGS